MPTARVAPGAVTINNRLYVVGGFPNGGPASSVVEVYDPQLNTWTPRSPMPTARARLALGVINNTLYAVGGFSGQPAAQSAVEAYDPSTNTWFARAPVNRERYGHAAGVIGGKLYVVGGTIGDSVQTVEEYDSATNTWVFKTPMPTPRFLLAAVAIGSKLYAVGGTNSLTGGSALGTLEVYTPATDSWETKAPMPVPRSDLAAAVFDGKMYVVGGFGAPGVGVVLEMYDPALDTWSTLASMPTSRGDLAAGVLDDKLFAVGGVSAPGMTELATVEIYTPAPPLITSPLVATGTVGLPFTYQFETIGATSLGVSNLPPGFTFTPSLATITGAPTATGIFPVGLSASNGAGTTNETLTITVQAAPAGLAIVSSPCATGRTGSPFSFQLQASGGSSATNFAVDPLPPGLNLDPVTGFISGTPTSDGSFGLAVSAIDGAATAQATLQLTFTSAPTVPIITSPNSAILTPGQFFTYTITADANGTFGYIGTDGIVHQGPSSAGLPPGLSFDGDRTISGTFNPGLVNGAKTNAADPKSKLPDGINLAGGIVTNVQLFATDPSGTGTFPLIGFIAAPGTVNISTRLAVGTGDNVLIGGFILTGTGTTRALIRAIGPSLTPLGVPNALQDPILELRDGAGALLGSNDNWQDNQSFPITDTGIPPSHNLESAILAFLSPGPYTAIVRGNNNTTGVALVEVYDLGIAALLPPGNARLANIATRGFADTGDNVLIGGFIVRPLAPATSTRVVIRAIGPSLPVPGVLQDPSLELKDANGTTLISNDDWQQGQPADIQEIQKLGLAPTDPRESAVIRTLLSGPYTAIVRGNGDTTGVALVEVYSLE